MRKLILLLICLGWRGILPVRADLINVSGDVSGTWAADTVLVSGEIRVPPGEALSIEAGVTVLFLVYCKFIVDNGAVLMAVGTDSSYIRFDGYTPATNWHGLRFLSASNSSRLEYCWLKNGLASGSDSDALGGGIYCYNTDLAIQNCRIEACSAIGWNGSGAAIYCALSNPTIVNNTLTGNSANYSGGALYCYQSSPIISDNIIKNNTAAYGGGAIYCYFSNPIISNNTIEGNSADWGCALYCSNSSPSISDNTISDNYVAVWGHAGGIYCVEYSSPTISNNIISGNSVTGYGGAIYCYYNSNPLISYNTLNNNSASSGGGAIFCHDSSPSINNNVIYGNTAYQGGGIYCLWAHPPINDNTIRENTVASKGGGIYCYGYSSTINGNCIVQNSAANGGGIFFDLYCFPDVSNCTIADNEAVYGGGIYCYNAQAEVINSILWTNNPEQIYLSGVSSALTTYSDVQGGWSGTGNLDLAPVFVDAAQSDYRLQWGSPCIDAGDPDSTYNDPDSSRADMGAYYFDQSLPVSVLLTPHSPPIEIPAEGGSFDYTIQLTNIDSLDHSVEVWCEAIQPNGDVYGPTLGPITVTSAAGTVNYRVRTQNVNGASPAGVYSYQAHAVTAEDSATDSFNFSKLVPPWLDEFSEKPYWQNATPDIKLQVEESLLDEFCLFQNFPNPFNENTTIAFALPRAAFVRLDVYDLAGRKVQTLLADWQNAGIHRVPFAGGDLSSGLYIYRLVSSPVSASEGTFAGGYTAAGKMILLK